MQAHFSVFVRQGMGRDVPGSEKLNVRNFGLIFVSYDGPFLPFAGGDV